MVWEFLVWEAAPRNRLRFAGSEDELYGGTSVVDSALS